MENKSIDVLKIEEPIDVMKNENSDVIDKKKRKKKKSKTSKTKNLKVYVPHHPKEQQHLGNPLYQWFIKLTPQERQMVLTVEDKPRIDMIKMMISKHTKKIRGYFWGIDKEGPFCYYDHHKYLDLKNLDGEYLDKSFSVADIELEQMIRLAEGEQHQDTLTIDRSCLKNGEYIMNLLFLNTRCKFLSETCEVEYDKIDKKWICGKPKWFDNRDYFTLATYISSLLEQALWIQFLRTNDTEQKKSIKKFTIPKSVQIERSLPYMAEFWSKLRTKEKTIIIGKTSGLIRHLYEEIEKTQESMTEPKGSKNKFTKSKQPKVGIRDMQKAKENCVTNISFLEFSLSISLQEDYIIKQSNQLLDKNNSLLFLESLFFSPLSGRSISVETLFIEIFRRVQSSYQLYLREALQPKANQSPEKQSPEKQISPKSKKTSIIHKTNHIKVEEEIKPKETIIPKLLNNNNNDSKIEIYDHNIRISESDPNDWNYIKSPKPRIINFTKLKYEKKEKSEELLKKNENKDIKPNLKQDIKKDIKLDKKQDLKEKPITKIKEKYIPKIPIIKKNDPIPKKLIIEIKIIKELAEEKTIIEETIIEERLIIEKKSIEEIIPNIVDIVDIDLKEIDKKEERKIILHDEIIEFLKITRKTIKDEIKPKINDYQSKIENIVQYIWNGANIKCYGSHSTGFAIVNSDLDIVLEGTNLPPKDSLQMLWGGLRCLGITWIKKSNNLFNASIPIIKLRTIDDLSIDITASDQSLFPTYPTIEGIEVNSFIPNKSKTPNYFYIPNNHQEEKITNNNLSKKNDQSIDWFRELKNIQCPQSLKELYNRKKYFHYGIFATEFLLEKKKEFPELLPIVLVVKQILYNKGLVNSDQNTGFSSYCVVLMILSFLQMLKRSNLPNPLNTKLNNEMDSPNQMNCFDNIDFGILIMNFFKFFGTEFDYSTTGISVSGKGQIFDLRNSSIKFTNDPMILIDPLDPYNNVAKHCVALFRLQITFKDCYQKLLNDNLLSLKSIM